MKTEFPSGKPIKSRGKTIELLWNVNQKWIIEMITTSESRILNSKIIPFSTAQSSSPQYIFIYSEEKISPILLRGFMD